ncbi:MAG: YIP1 family protein [Chloroflexota bacterium]
MSTLPSVSIPEMINQSKMVLTKPSPTTFEQYERQGTVTNAAIYVGLASVVTGLLNFVPALFSEASAFGGLISGIISTLFGFFVFTGLVYYIGRNQGGTGTYEEVAYTFALFWAPLAILASVITFILMITIIGILLVPLVVIAAIVLNIYFAYMAVQSSMNLTDRSKILLTLVAAGVGTLLIQLFVGLF